MGEIKFIVMGLVSHSLDSIRRDILERNFRLGPFTRGTVAD